MASYTVRVTGLSTSDSPEQWVCLQLVGLGGRQVEHYFRSADIVASPNVLFKVASDVGIPLLRHLSRNELLTQMVPRGGIEPPTLRFSEAVLVNEFNDLARPHSAKLALYNSQLQNPYARAGAS